MKLNSSELSARWKVTQPVLGCAEARRKGHAHFPRRTFHTGEDALCHFQKIEAGSITILVTTLHRLRNALGCDWRRLLGT